MPRGQRVSIWMESRQEMEGMIGNLAHPKPISAACGIFDWPRGPSPRCRHAWSAPGRWGPLALPAAHSVDQHHARPPVGMLPRETSSEPNGKPW